MSSVKDSVGYIYNKSLTKMGQCPILCHLLRNWFNISFAKRRFVKYYFTKSAISNVLSPIEESV